MAKETTLPQITLQQAQLSWFLHDDKAYSVADCDGSVFKAAILAVMDRKRLSDLGSLQDTLGILTSELDLFSRWWLLCHCGLEGTKRPLKLYASREEAEKALEVEVEQKCCCADPLAECKEVGAFCCARSERSHSGLGVLNSLEDEETLTVRSGLVME